MSRNEADLTALRRPHRLATIAASA